MIPKLDIIEAPDKHGRLTSSTVVEWYLNLLVNISHNPAVSSNEKVILAIKICTSNFSKWFHQSCCSMPAGV